MTIVQLRCFIAMAEELNFTRTAKKLYISQTAVSYHIRALEKELGVDLFARTTRKVALTEVGKQFYRDIREAVHKIDDAYEAVRRSSSKQTFSIGYSALCYGRRFREIVDQLSTEFPSMRIFLNNVEPEDNLFELLQGGQIDAALFLNPFIRVPEGITARDFGKVRHMLMVPVSHPLARRDSIDSNELQQYQYQILAHAGIKRMERMDASMFEQVVEPGQVGQPAPKNLESLLTMVRAGFCLARLPALDEIELTGVRCLVVVRKDGDLSPGPNLTVAWRSTGVSPQIERLCAAVERAVCSENN